MCKPRCAARARQPYLPPRDCESACGFLRGCFSLLGRDAFRVSCTGIITCIENLASLRNAHRWSSLKLLPDFFSPVVVPALRACRQGAEAKNSQDPGLHLLLPLPQPARSTRCRAFLSAAREKSRRKVELSRHYTGVQQYRHYVVAVARREAVHFQRQGVISPRVSFTQLHHVSRAGQPDGLRASFSTFDMKSKQA